MHGFLRSKAFMNDYIVQNYHHLILNYPRQDQQDLTGWNPFLLSPFRINNYNIRGKFQFTIEMSMKSF